MFKDPIKLGEAFALLEAKINNNVDFPTYMHNAVDIDILKNMNQSYHDYKKAETKHTFSNKVCIADESLLKSNEIYLATHIILDKSSPTTDEYHKQFIKHLNDCYWCFKFYSHVVRDYHWARKQIETWKGESK